VTLRCSPGPAAAELAHRLDSCTIIRREFPAVQPKRSQLAQSSPKPRTGLRVLGVA